MISINNKLKGAISAELAIILLFLSTMLVLIINHLIAFNKKAMLDRASYSAVTILAERKQLFNNEINLCVDQSACDIESDKIFNFVASSLKRMDASFDKAKLGLRVDSVFMTYDDVEAELVLDNVRLMYGKTSNCNFPGVSDVDPELLPQVSFAASDLLDGNVYLPLYQVSLCYEIPLDLIGVTTGEVLRLISTSFSFARI
ncbi:MAG: tight adherence pilus pseudopilin TadF [Vibrio sp.]|uniref:tight adherence pilus pseudopilin TadF n=1 Tax=Vibrio sp. TaxID=678 RepID=UPI003A842019